MRLGASTGRQRILQHMSLLDAEIQTLFGSVFGALYLDGTLTRVTLVDDGFGGLTQNSADEPIKVQRDACTEQQRLEQGYSASDVRLLILQSGVDVFDTNCRVTVLGETYQLGPVITQDPARSYFEARGIQT